MRDNVKLPLTETPMCRMPHKSLRCNQNSAAKWKRRRSRERIKTFFRSTCANFEDSASCYLEQPWLFAALTVAAAVVTFVFALCVTLDYPSRFWESLIAYMLFSWLIALLCACAIWQVKWAARTTSLLPVRLFMSGLLFIMLQLSRIDSARHLKARFPIDPNQLPYALNFGATIIMMGLLSLAFVVVLITCYIASFILLFQRSGLSKGGLSAGMTSLLLCAIFCISLVAVCAAGSALGFSSKTDVLMARLAGETDFSENSLCEGMHLGERVVRLGSQGDRGIAAPFGNSLDTSFIKFSADQAKNLLPAPKKFHAVDCNLHKETNMSEEVRAKFTSPSQQPNMPRLKPVM